MRVLFSALILLATASILAACARAEWRYWRQERNSGDRVPIDSRVAEAQLLCDLYAELKRQQEVEQ